MKKNFIKAISFFTLLILLFISLNSIFINKVGHRAKIYAGAYDKSIKYDVAFIGSSHMNSSLSPYILWENYGITSYNLGTGGQPLDVSYYLLKELLKNHSDLKVVVVDLYYAGLTDPYGSEGYIRYVLDNMKLSSNKIDAIKNCTPKNERLYYLFPLLKYHTRWKELRENDFKFNYDASRYDKGFSAARGAYGSDNLGDTTTEEIGEIPEKSEEYIYKFINLSKEYNFGLVFTNAPYDYSSTSSLYYWVEKPAEMFNKIALIAEENNIPFINYSSQKMLDEINFDFKNDMYNIGHMNIVGANKVSTHFANFLNENYNLPNHKSDPDYANWQVEADGFSQREKTMDIIYIYDLQSYTDYILNEDSFIGLYFDTKSNTPSVTIYDKDVNTYSIDTTNSTSITLSDGTNILINTYIEDDIIFKININDSSIDIKNNSHTITVYDKVLNEFVDSVPVEDTKLIR